MSAKKKSTIKKKPLRIHVLGDVVLDDTEFVEFDRPNVAEDKRTSIYRTVKQELTVGGAGAVVRQLHGVGCSVSLQTVFGRVLAKHGSVVDGFRNLLFDAVLGFGALANVPIKRRIYDHKTKRLVLRVDDESPFDVDIRRRMAKGDDKFSSPFGGCAAYVIADYKKGCVSDWRLRLLGKVVGDAPVVIDPGLGVPWGKYLRWFAHTSGLWIKCNEREFNAVCVAPVFKRRPFSEMVKLASQQHNCNVVVTRGARDVVFACHGIIGKCRVPKVDAVNTVGCGDTFAAMLAYGLAKRDNASDAIYNAAVYSSAQAMVSGCAEAIDGQASIRALKGK